MRPAVSHSIRTAPETPSVITACSGYASPAAAPFTAGATTVTPTYASHGTSTSGMRGLGRDLMSNPGDARGGAEENEQGHEVDGDAQGAVEPRRRQRPERRAGLVQAQGERDPRGVREHGGGVGRCRTAEHEREARAGA